MREVLYISNIKPSCSSLKESRLGVAYRIANLTICSSVVPSTVIGESSKSRVRAMPGADTPKSLAQSISVM